MLNKTFYLDYKVKMVDHKVTLWRQVSLSADTWTKIIKIFLVIQIFKLIMIMRIEFNYIYVPFGGTNTF